MEHEAAFRKAIALAMDEAQTSVDIIKTVKRMVEEESAERTAKTMREIFGTPTKENT
jgi:hypothetical protein